MGWIRNRLANLTGRGTRRNAARLFPALPAAAVRVETRPKEIATEGSQPGWLRVLSAEELLTAVRAGDALDGAVAQSKLAQAAFRRDLLAAIRNYAEFVQLMPASESHHHAHAGGLLVHTLEMVLAALTWRNGHFLPEGAAVEQIAAEHDQWTYVVFFAALLHDIAKPMTDLRIQWRAAQMTEALRWTPVAGSLVQVTQGRTLPEYRVEFTSKAARDYGAHSRLALTILHQIAPVSALRMLASTPQAMDALARFLSGQDKTSLVARIVRRADQVSAAHALLSGSRARFATAKSVPLIELLMGALRSMVREGGDLPLNRSGAAGWIYDGSAWFVAKRLADAVRAWIKANVPEEGIPGEAKNDRLFDTWQEYGVVQLNPQTGQAIWYVTVHGAAAKSQSAEAGGSDGGEGYEHSLSVLRFPLEKLFDDASAYPPEMLGRIEIRSKKAEGRAGAESVMDGPEAAPAKGNAAGAPARRQKAGPSSKTGDRADRIEPPDTVQAPVFNKARAAAVQAKAVNTGPDPALSCSGKPTNGPATEALRAGAGSKTPAVTITVPMVTGRKWAAAAGQVASNGLDQEAGEPTAAATPNAPAPQAVPAAPRASRVTKRAERDASLPGDLVEGDADDAVAPPHLQGASSTSIPVFLAPRLPRVPGAAVDGNRTPASTTALAFMAWLQQGLASREIAYNESRAPVHFVREGMALVSPGIFKLYAGENPVDEAGEEPWVLVQKEVLKASWHRTERNARSGRVNILGYSVKARSGGSKTRLSMIVIEHPERWVYPVPHANDALCADLGKRDASSAA